MKFHFAKRELDLSHPHVMGILNVTPDSFSDGGQYHETQKAVARALAMLQEGASIIDIGGESTRPNSTPVSVAEELQRVIPVIQQLREQSDCIISIDTAKPEVMLAAAEAGADMINDVYSLQRSGALTAAAKTGLPVCLMHMQGEPNTMQVNPQYKNVIDDIRAFLDARVQACLAAGIPAEKIMLDPGFGFGKTLDHNLTLLKQLNAFADCAFPLVVGLSRKYMIEKALGLPMAQRLPPSIALAVIAVERGAHIVRCHDVKATKDAIDMAHCVFQAKEC